MSDKTPKSMRLHIGIYGRRNVGKSSLLNALTRQQVSIVSEHAGTTTDPVEKPMELLPLGPVLFIDTAGIDDTGALGSKRVEKTKKCIERTDLAIIVSTGSGWGSFEEEILSALEEQKTPVIIVFNKTDLEQAPADILDKLDARKLSVVRVSSITGHGLNDLRQVIVGSAPPDFLSSHKLVSDIVGAGEMALLVVPIDKEAPKGRLILPQVQVMRDLLDAGAFFIGCREHELKDALKALNRRPKIVITDSQAFHKVCADTPHDIMVTGFSILFARFKGDLTAMVRNTVAVDKLKNGDKVLIAEACTHHPITDDIGRVKIPNWIRKHTGADIRFETYQGHDFPDNLKSYSLVVHCGACMHTRHEMLNRIKQCENAGVPITNYGLAIAYSLGLFERALRPFPAALAAYREVSSK